MKASSKSEKSFERLLSIFGMESSVSFMYHPAVKEAPHPLLILLSRICILVFSSIKTPWFIMKYAFMASSYQVASSFLPEKSSRSPALISLVHRAILWLGGRGGFKGFFFTSDLDIRVRNRSW